ncbi:hypothetical protein ACFY7F_37685 [Streptomyces griseofuscus]|uniref:hypothetical protein n=1 Tax=Streptomyces griseofuscus TaxID=146922 RepID=UPI0036B05CB0
MGSVTGNAIGGYALVVVVALGPGTMVERTAPVYSVIKPGGAAYLILLGVKAVRARPVVPKARAAFGRGEAAAAHGVGGHDGRGDEPERHLVPHGRAAPVCGPGPWARHGSDAASRAGRGPAGPLVRLRVRADRRGDAGTGSAALSAVGFRRARGRCGRDRARSQAFAGPHQLTPVSPARTAADGRQLQGQQVFHELPSAAGRHHRRFPRFRPHARHPFCPERRGGILVRP